MAEIRPFKALRPAKEAAEKVASVPYDVVNREEARELAKDNPFSFLHITRSEVDLPDTVNPYDKQVYQKAKENLEWIKANAPLLLDDKPRYYLYELEMDGRKQVGLCAVFAVDDYDNDIILKHEKTRKVKEDDRTNHIITTETQTGVVFLTYRGVDKVNEIVANVISAVEPLYNMTSEDGIRHSIWTLPDEHTAAITEAIGGVDKLYVADGHHRAKSASRAREEMKKRNAQHSGDEEYNYFIAVLFPGEQLHILPYNRVVTDLNGMTTDDFKVKLEEKFTVKETTDPNAEERRNIKMYLEGKWYSLYLRDEFFENGKLKDADSVGDTLDVSILQNYLLTPFLDIDDPRTSERIDFVGGIRGTAELEKLVGSGKYAVAFSMYPVTVDDLMNISDAGEVMPPKSTWFEPKLRDGFLVHTI
jgi:uncharacterized protein (DUF1015 family)